MVNLLEHTYHLTQLIIDINNKDFFLFQSPENLDNGEKIRRLNFD